MTGMAFVNYLRLFMIARQPCLAKLPVVMQTHARTEQLPNGKVDDELRAIVYDAFALGHGWRGPPLLRGPLFLYGW
jgi:hypothetical protein